MQVRQQTLDLISLMTVASGLSEYFMFMEDDFPMCEAALPTLDYVIRKVKTAFTMSHSYIRQMYISQTGMLLGLLLE